LSDIDTVSYYLIIATAGHDTTEVRRFPVAWQALIENPDQLAASPRINPSLMPLAAEEMIRWVTPVKEVHAYKRAKEDATIRGVPIAAGRISAVVPTLSANRDERRLRRSVFRFDRRAAIQTRQRGVRLRRCTSCLGAALARMEVGSFFSELFALGSTRSRPTGRPTKYRDIFVGGLKHLPIRYSLK